MITFEYPVSAPTITLTLPNPELGDAERIALSNIFGRTRVGNVINKYDAGRPALTTLSWVIRKLTAVQRSNLLVFLHASAGDEFKVTDYNGDTFNALLQNTMTVLTTIREDCNYEVPIELLVVS